MPPHISLADFSGQFPRLVLDARDLPRKPVPFHILLISVVTGLAPERSYSEAELNDEIQRWIMEFGSRFGIDHANIRRYLIDEGYLSRDPSGSEYRLDPEGTRFAYDPAIRDLDFKEMIAEERVQREARKREFTGGE